MVDNIYERDEKRNDQKRISWGAIFAGGLSAIAISILLNLLGFGLGFATINPIAESDPFSGLGTGTIIWWIVSNLIALFCGGMVAGRMAGFVSNIDGGLHGFLAWGFYATVSLIFLTSTVGFVISGVTGALSSVFGGGDNQQTVVRIVNSQQQQNQNQQGFSYNNIKGEVFDIINRAERYNILPEGSSEEVRQILQEGRSEALQMWQQLNLDQNIAQFFNELSFNLDDEGNLNITVEGGEFIDKQEIREYLTANTDLSDQEINQMINRWDKNMEQAVMELEDLYQETKQKLEKYSGQLADTIADVSLISFFAFLVGAIAAFGGGAVATKSHPGVVQKENYRRKETME